MWVTDVDAGLRAYKAIPDSNGNLVKIQFTSPGSLNKFQRPVFGDGRLYITGDWDPLLEEHKILTKPQMLSRI